MISRRSLLRIGAGAAALGLIGCTPEEPQVTPSPSAPPTPPIGGGGVGGPHSPILDTEAVAHDAYAGWVRRVLQHFVTWLDGRPGFIGEVGWPGPEGPYSIEDLERWDRLGRMWLREAHRHGLWVTYWASGPWPENYATVAHVGNPPTDITRPGQALIDLRAEYPQGNGVNLAGWEWDWTHQPQPESFQWLADHGITLIRVPFDWELVQRHPMQRLAPDGVRVLLKVLDDAARAGCEVVLDCHNYEQVYHWNDFRPPRLMRDEEFYDLWVRLSEAVRGHPAVSGYGLMNEPNPETGSTARDWERRSRECVEILRDLGDRSRMFVNTFNWSTLHDVDDHHPDGPWIDDENTFYEGHHYFDPWEGGNYRQSYETYKQRIGSELAGFQADGFIERF